jgi:hypothetical protein
MKHPLLDPMPGAETRVVGGVQVDVVQAGTARVKRMIYPPGFSWSKDLKAAMGTDYCQHAHVGFLAQGEIDVHYPDGCVEKFRAPQAVAVPPGHDGVVIGNEPAVMIEVDFGNQTGDKFGMPDAHRH